MRPVHCDRPSALHAVVCTAGLSILVAATAVPFDVIVVVNVAVVVVVTIAIAVVVVVIVSSASTRPRETCWARVWRPLVVAATLLTRAHLPPRGDIFDKSRCPSRSPQSHTDM